MKRGSNPEHQQDRLAIAARLNGIDELFHHTQDDVRDWSRHHHQQIGQLGILSKTELIESTLHHLMHDAGVLHASAAGVTASTVNATTGDLGDPDMSPPHPASDVWHIAVNGQAQGPFNETQLARSIHSGKVLPSTLVWSPAIGNWPPAGQVPGLSGLFGATPPPPPVVPSGSVPASRGTPLTTAPPSTVP